ncbi:MAG TPA: hypothetical protein ENN06_09025 [Desulfobacteraceae bacterium]|nr:hypothetical protein [Desulfobacteraceae bacterium]
MKKMLVPAAAVILILTWCSLPQAADQPRPKTQEFLQSLQTQAGYPVGTVIKAEGRSELYIMVPVGRAAHIPTVQILKCLDLQDRKPVVISRQELGAIPTSPLLLRSPGGNIYRISGDRKRLITSPAVFERLGYDPASVLPMTDAQLNCIRDGEPVR